MRIVDDDRDSSTDGMPKVFDLSKIPSRKKPILDFYGTGKAMEFGASDRKGGVAAIEDLKINAGAKPLKKINLRRFRLTANHQESKFGTN